MANTGELPPRITEDLGHPTVEHSTPKPRAFESTSSTLNGILTGNTASLELQSHFPIRTCHVSQGKSPSRACQGHRAVEGWKGETTGSPLLIVIIYFYA